jgi:hypothetical protein
VFLETELFLRKCFLGQWFDCRLCIPRLLVTGPEKHFQEDISGPRNISQKGFLETGTSWKDVPWQRNIFQKVIWRKETFWGRIHFGVFLRYEDYISLHKYPDITQTIPSVDILVYLSTTRAQISRGIIPMDCLYRTCYQYLDCILLLTVPDIPQTIPLLETTYNMSRIQLHIYWHLKSNMFQALK